MSDEIEIVIDSNETIVESELIIDVVNNNNIVDIGSSEPDVVVTFEKQEYVIVGDDMYIPLSYDEAPQWLKDTIANITDFSLNQKLTEIGALSTTLYGLIKELEVAKNTYTQSIITSAEIDERINARIETLNSSLSGSDATIVDLIATKATPTEASSLALDVLTSSINDGAISSLVSNLQNAISTTNSTLSNNIDIVHSEMTGEFNANAEAIDAIETSVTSINGTLTSHAGQITNLQASASTVDGKIATANSSVINTVNTTIADGDAVVTSKWAYNSTLNIGGTNYNSGFGLSNSSGTGVGSEFWINAEKFKFTNTNKTGSAAPFTIDASGSQPQITFNGRVTFGSGQTGTIDQAIAAVVETVAVGDKNINITDNLIPTTSLVADTDNSGYQFIGTPTKSMSAGLESFSEAQIILDGSDEAYSPYVDEVTIPYYYRFGIKGITNLDRFKVVTINASNVVTYNNVTVTMEVGKTLSTGNWYTVDGIINPLGGTTTADGDIRDINGVKVGSINNFVIPVGTTKVLLGWIADCTISRMKMCKITADTITSDFSSVNGQLTNLQSQIDNVDVSWNSLSGKDIFAQEQGFTNYADMVNKYTSLGKTIINGGYINTGLVNANSIIANSISADRLMAGTNGATVWTNGGLVSQNFNGNVYGNIGNPTSGFRLSSGAAGNTNDPNIYGAYIKGSTIEGITLNTSDIKVKAEGYPNNFGRVNYVTSGGGIVMPGVGTGYYMNRVCSSTLSYVKLEGWHRGATNSLSAYLQYSLNGGTTWITLSSKNSQAYGYQESFIIYFAELFPLSLPSLVDTVFFRITGNGSGAYSSPVLVTIYNN